MLKFKIAQINLFLHYYLISFLIIIVKYFLLFSHIFTLYLRKVSFPFFLLYSNDFFQYQFKITIIIFHNLSQLINNLKYSILNLNDHVKTFEYMFILIIELFQSLIQKILYNLLFNLQAIAFDLFTRY